MMVPQVVQSTPIQYDPPQNTQSEQQNAAPLLLPYVATPGVIRSTGAIIATILLSLWHPSVASAQEVISRSISGLFEARERYMELRIVNPELCQVYAYSYNSVAKTMSDEERTIEDADVLPKWLDPKACGK